MNVRKIVNSITNYFNLNAGRITAFDSGYNFIVKDVDPRSIGQHVKDYFSLVSHFPQQAADDIMRLANAEGITKGRYDSSGVTERMPMTYSEGNFDLATEAGGIILVKCDVAFAEKIKKLPSVASVKAINTSSPTPKTDTPKL